MYWSHWAAEREGYTLEGGGANRKGVGLSKRASKRAHHSIMGRGLLLWARESGGHACQPMSGAGALPFVWSP